MAARHTIITSMPLLPFLRYLIADDALQEDDGNKIRIAESVQGVSPATKTVENGRNAEPFANVMCALNRKATNGISTLFSLPDSPHVENTNYTLPIAAALMTDSMHEAWGPRSLQHQHVMLGLRVWIFWIFESWSGEPYLHVARHLFQLALTLEQGSARALHAE